MSDQDIASAPPLFTSEVTTSTAPSRAALYAALAKAQGEFLAIPKNKTVQIPIKSGGSYTFKYADLESIMRACRPALSENGLAVFQSTDRTQAGEVLVTTLAHSSGATLMSEVAIPKASGDIKEYGAVITYLRRYQITALLGVAADDDLDADGRGIEEDDDIRELTNKLVDEAMMAKTDDEALGLWKKHMRGLAANQASYQRLRMAVEQRRAQLRDSKGAA